MEGVKSFFAPAGRVSVVPGNPYEILFNPDATVGEKGSEGMIVLASQPPEFLSFTCNSPPELARVRGQITFVEVRFEEVDKSRTLVNIRHSGWGGGGQWDAAYEYFSRAWEQIVLPRLAYRFAHGPVDWDNPPQR
jgi:uncharacterized protein YndB with AHSA1/START domain